MNTLKMIRKRQLLTAVAIAAGVVAGPVVAQDSRPATVNKAERQKSWTTDKDAMEAALGTGKNKAFYRQSLEKMGYWITAVNNDSANRLEYEVVKGPNSYEVQVDFRDNVSTKVDVTTNVWKAPGTRTAMSDRNYKYVYPAGVTPNADRVSDAARNKTCMDEKGRMEKELGVGHDRGYYKTALEKMGYKITSVNENDKKNLEYEVVKGDTSYEVQVDFDNAGKSTRVGVSTNMWEADTTERVKGDK